MSPDEMKRKILELDGDIYLMTQSIKDMNTALTDLKAKYELLLNRIKCTECNLRNKQEHDPTTDTMA